VGVIVENGPRRGLLARVDFRSAVVLCVEGPNSGKGAEHPGQLHVSEKPTVAEVVRVTAAFTGGSNFVYASSSRACYPSADLNWSTPRKGRRFIFMKSAASLSRKKRRGEGALFLAVFMCGATVLWGQNSPGSISAHPAVSLADYLTGPGNVEHHIFYVHGIGAGGPNDNDSQLLRISICKLLGDCTTKKGVLEGTDYADKHSFALNASPPKLTYFGEPVWKSTPPGGLSNEWNASAPYVDHWKLIRTNGTIIYVEEINWWPLVFPLKCREIVAKDAALLGPNRAYLDLCSQSVPDRSQPGRFRLYPWIPADEAKRLKALPVAGALLNRELKNGLLDWRFSDALLAVGGIQPLMLEGIRQLILKSARVVGDGSAAGSVGPRPNQEFVFVTHSLGSYLIFSALDFKPSESDTTEMQEWEKQFRGILARTPIVYFFANQLRLLELANLDSSRNVIDRLKTWSELRTNYLAAQSGSKTSEVTLPRLVAWNDPSDLLTWNIPEIRSSSGDRIVSIENRPVRNAIDWFWLLEGPTSAHDNYASNKRIIRAMLKPTKYKPRKQ
jgi:hypothetical protein